MSARKNRLIGALPIFAAMAVSALLAACDRPPSATGLSDWTAADHDQDQESMKAQLPKRGDAGAGGGAASVVELTWRAQCAQCHGMTGHGDGPTGPMLKATNFGDPEWQKRVQDGEIASAIQNGKGKMPKFDLSEPVVRGLVAKIRAVPPEQ
jgi:mono/diheme cytochrome c family protein